MNSKKLTAEFYENSEIFMTGGSGVVGKAAIEKLLRSCNVKKIYILLRSKKGVNPEDRLVDLKNSKIFRVLKESRANELNKLVAIPGDTTLDGLGISTEHRDLMKNVSIFIHSAATTRFNEPLRKAFLINVKGTMEALKLAETFQNLNIFMHVSTFFSNPYLEYVENKVYPALFDWRAAIKMLDVEYDEMEPVIDAITDKVIQGFPNTYTFTKHLAEKMVDDYRSKLPVAIFRPSVVVMSIEEPEPGFTETSTGGMGLALAMGAGLLQVLKGKEGIQIDFTPLDIGTRYLLIFGANAGQLPREKFKEATPVSIFSTSSVVNYSSHLVVKSVIDCYHENPYEKSIWIPGLRLTSSSFIYVLYTYLFHVLPAIFVDVLLKLFRQKPFMMKIQRKILVSMEVLGFFLNKEYKSDGPTDLKEVMKAEEGTEFDLNVFFKYMEDEEKVLTTARLMHIGVRKFLLNEDDSSVPKCQKILKAKKIVYNIIRCYLAYVVGSAIYRRLLAYLNIY